jgi:hypothetical protein
VSHQEDFSVANIYERHELADRIGASVRIYAEDHEVDVDSAAERLVQLASGDRAALDQAHRSVLLRARETGDPITRRSLKIVREAVEQAGSC